MRRCFAGLLALALAIPVVCRASNFSFTGSFTSDDNVQEFTFTVGALSTVTLQTWSYAGGVDATGQLIATGGFDPILWLFDSSGAAINHNDDSPLGTPIDLNTSEVLDSYLQTPLNPGTYTVALIEYFNQPNSLNLSGGFVETGHGDFTALFGCSNGAFCDPAATAPYDNRTPNWELDIDGVRTAALVPMNPTPEPSSLALLGSTVLGAAAAMRRRLFR
jgi:hypothetical protein